MNQIKIYLENWVNLRCNPFKPSSSPPWLPFTVGTSKKKRFRNVSGHRLLWKLESTLAIWGRGKICRLIFKLSFRAPFNEENTSNNHFWKDRIYYTLIFYVSVKFHETFLLNKLPVWAEGEGLLNSCFRVS